MLISSSRQSARAEDADELAQLLETLPNITFYHYNLNNPVNPKYCPPSAKRPRKISGKPPNLANIAKPKPGKIPRKALAEIILNPTTTLIPPPMASM
jgi:hypothetical protein